MIDRKLIVTLVFILQCICLLHTYKFIHVCIIYNDKNIPCFFIVCYAKFTFWIHNSSFQYVWKILYTILTHDENESNAWENFISPVLLLIYFISVSWIHFSHWNQNLNLENPFYVKLNQINMKNFSIEKQRERKRTIFPKFKVHFYIIMAYKQKKKIILTFIFLILLLVKSLLRKKHLSQPECVEICTLASKIDEKNLNIAFLALESMHSRRFTILFRDF